MNYLKLIGYLFLFLSICMIYIVIDTSLASNMFDVLPYLTKEPWFNTTIIDFYFNIAIIAAWMFYKENNVVAALCWLLSFVCLGSIATCFYVAWQVWLSRHHLTWDQVLLRKENKHV